LRNSKKKETERDTRGKGPKRKNKLCIHLVTFFYKGQRPLEKK